IPTSSSARPTRSRSGRRSSAISTSPRFARAEAAALNSASTMRWRPVLGNLASGAAALLAAIVALILAMDLLGDPASYQLPMEADEAARAAFRAEHGLDRPLVVRAARQLAALATGTLGESQWLRRPAAAVVM